MCAFLLIPDEHGVSAKYLNSLAYSGIELEFRLRDRLSRCETCRKKGGNRPQSL